MRGSYLEAGEQGYFPQTDWYIVVWISLEWALELEQTYTPFILKSSLLMLYQI